MKTSYIAILTIILSMLVVQGCTFKTSKASSKQSHRDFKVEIDAVRSLGLSRVLVMKEKEDSDVLVEVGCIDDSQVVEALLNSIRLAPAVPSGRVQFGDSMFIIVPTHHRVGIGLELPNFQIPLGEVPSSFEKNLFGKWEFAERDFKWQRGNVLCINWKAPEIVSIYQLLLRVGEQRK